MPPKKRQQARSVPSPRGAERGAAPSVLTRSPETLPTDLLTLPSLDTEWMEADGVGGFASGTVAGIRTRRHHALLLIATRPPGGRVVLVNGFDARVTTPRGAYDLTSHRYAPDVIHPDGFKRVETFTSNPWPTWVFHLEDGTRIEQELFTVTGAPGSLLTWRVADGSPRGVRLSVRPLLSGRDADALHHENAHFQFEATSCDTAVRWHPYHGVPGVLAGSNGSYAHHPLWYRKFLYTEDRDRGLDCVEDLVSPGTFHFDLSRADAVLVLTTDEGLRSMKAAARTGAAGLPGFLGAASGTPERALDVLREGERAHRRAFATRLHRSADAYLVHRREGTAIVAGYPCPGDRGRDTFIALRGLCLAAGRLDEARQILLEWAGKLDAGMMPGSFEEPYGPPRFDSVDASLWFVIAAHDYLRAAAAQRRRVPAADRKALQAAMGSVVFAYAGGTRHGIGMDGDGLLAAGATGMALTWMDAHVDGRPVTPRVGKPVEVQALWLNALRIVGEWAPRWMEEYQRGMASFARRFWHESAGCLYDVVDVDHTHGVVDATVRPNQIFAVGGVPYPVLEGTAARRVVDLVEARLFTPAGLRTLAPGDSAYKPRWEGGARERELAAHQGPVWPWLIGPFVEAWVRVRGGGADVKMEARERFLAPVLARLEEGGVGHLSEICDAEAPFASRGCPFKAWSLAEVIRLDQEVLRG